MDPESLNTVQPYLVLAYDIRTTRRGQPQQDYYLLDFRAYQRPEFLTDAQMEKVACDLIRNRFGIEAETLKLKVIES